MGFTTDRFALTTSVYDDTQQSAVALHDLGVNVPTLEQINSTGWWAPNFDAVGDKLAFFHQFHHGMAETGTVTVEPHLHVMTSSDSANIVRFQLTFQWLNNGEDLGADDTDTLDVTPDAYNLQMLDFTPVSKAGALISSMFGGTLTRITNGGTDYTGEVYLVSFDIHFRKDTLGSDADDTKTFPS